MHTKIEEAVSFIRSEWGNFNPTTSLICGSGWGDVTQAFSKLQVIQYTDIPGMSHTTVSGHAGNLLLAEQNNQSILIFQGRRHFYEGGGWGPIQFPVLLAYALGAKILFVTNAAGGISSDFQVGDLMVVEDHLNFMPGNPLIGPVLHREIPRFPDQSEVYDRTLQDHLLEIATLHQIPVHRGCYLAISGPAFETPAEIRAFAKLGADAVGMSTVPEAMIANALGMKVIGLSCISNLAAGISDQTLSHQDVEDAAIQALPNMKKIILEFTTKIAGDIF